MTDLSDDRKTHRVIASWFCAKRSRYLTRLEISGCWAVSTDRGGKILKWFF